MKKFSMWLCSLSLLLSASAPAQSALSEEANYILDNSDDRTSWVFNSATAKVSVIDYQDHEQLGPSYLVQVDYEADILLLGYKSGSVGVWLPEAVFTDNFYINLNSNSSNQMDGFSIDYQGIEQGFDGNDQAYDQCIATKITSIDRNYFPFIDLETRLPKPRSGASEIFDMDSLEIDLKVHPSIPVIGAVQLDISATIFGIDVMAGLNYMP